jgi:hypothetical protein
VFGVVAASRSYFDEDDIGPQHLLVWDSERRAWIELASTSRSGERGSSSEPSSQQ